jgi:hypothetical protein
MRADRISRRLCGAPANVPGLPACERRAGHEGLHEARPVGWSNAKPTAHTLTTPLVDAMCADGLRVGEAMGAQRAKATSTPSQSFDAQALRTNPSEVRLWLSGRVWGVWCDGCRQSPRLMAVSCALREGTQHEGCPAGEGVWRLLVEVVQAAHGVIAPNLPTLAQVELLKAAGAPAEVVAAVTDVYLALKCMERAAVHMGAVNGRQLPKAEQRAMNGVRLALNDALGCAQRAGVLS